MWNSPTLVKHGLVVNVDSLCLDIWSRIISARTGTFGSAINALLIELVGVLGDGRRQFLAFVTGLELHGTGLLKVALLGHIQDLVQCLALKARLNEVTSQCFWIVVPVRASMAFPWADTLHDNTHAVPRGPIDFFALFSVVVADAVSVLLVEFVAINLGKLATKKPQGVIQRQANS